MHARTLGLYNLPVNVCEVCRSSNEKRNKETQCDIDQLCSKTKNLINDEDEPMDILQEVKDVKYLWDKITSLSPLQEIKQKGTQKGEVITRHIPSITSIDIVFNNENFDSLSVNKYDALDYLIQFHTSYINGLINA